MVTPMKHLVTIPRGPHRGGLSRLRWASCAICGRLSAPDIDLETARDAMREHVRVVGEVAE